MSDLGDRLPGQIIDFKFTTVDGTGLPTTLAGSPVVSVYKNNSTTQSTSGVTLTVDFDSITGLNHVRIDTSADATFYAAGNDFQAVITTGTVGGISVVGYELKDFSLAYRTVAVRLGAFVGSGLNTVKGYLESMMRKDASLTPSGVGGTYDNTTDSLEAQEENGPYLIV
jgi:hypothetical protein